MLTDQISGHILRWLAAAAVVVSVALAVIVPVSMAATPELGQPAELAAVPDDVRGLGLQLDVAVPSKVTEGNALDIASKEVGDRTAGGSADAYLLRVSDPMTARSDNPVVARDVWVVRYTGFDWYVPGPATDSGEPSTGHLVQKGYVYVDATSGEYLLTRWTE